MGKLTVHTMLSFLRGFTVCNWMYLELEHIDAYRRYIVGKVNVIRGDAWR